MLLALMQQMVTATNVVLPPPPQPPSLFRLFGSDWACAEHLSCNGWQDTTLYECFAHCIANELPAGCTRKGGVVERCHFVGWTSASGLCHLDGLNACNPLVGACGGVQLAFGTSLHVLAPTVVQHVTVCHW